MDTQPVPVTQHEVDVLRPLVHELQRQNALYKNAVDGIMAYCKLVRLEPRLQAAEEMILQMVEDHCLACLENL